LNKELNHGVLRKGGRSSGSPLSPPGVPGTMCVYLRIFGPNPTWKIRIFPCVFKLFGRSSLIFTPPRQLSKRTWCQAPLSAKAEGFRPRKGLEGRGPPQVDLAFPQGMERSGTPQSPAAAAGGGAPRSLSFPNTGYRRSGWTFSRSGGVRPCPRPWAWG
jgi:hypothetical protein